MTESLYSKRSGLILGFHGCDYAVMKNLVSIPNFSMTPSKNDYDWLGTGMYFWENNEERALEYANESMRRKDSKIINPSVVGAVIDLGLCLDLTDSRCLQELRIAYQQLIRDLKFLGQPIPKNSNVGESNDLYLRNLDCAVINYLHQWRRWQNLPPYDSVRGAFFEGGDLYPNAGFKEKSHIQICIINPNCINGFFIPRKKN